MSDSILVPIQLMAVLFNQLNSNNAEIARLQEQIAWFERRERDK